MLLLDVLLYGFLAWYLNQVLPSEYGVARPPWFIFLPSYWYGTAEGDRGSLANLANPLLGSEVVRQSEDDDENMELSCPAEKVRVSLHDLSS